VGAEIIGSLSMLKNVGIVYNQRVQAGASAVVACNSDEVFHDELDGIDLAGAECCLQLINAGFDDTQALGRSVSKIEGVVQPFQCYYAQLQRLKVTQQWAPPD
jgi:hypothetical protein